MRILILDQAAPATSHSGKAVRLINILQRLRPAHELRYLSIVGPDDAQAVPDWMQALVVSSQVWTRQEQEFRLGRYLNWIAMQPWFYAPWRYPSDFRPLRAKLECLMEEQEIDLIHCFDGEVAQFIPSRSRWIFDPADAMSLHAARRIHETRDPLRQLSWRSLAWRMRRYERKLIDQANASVFVSDVDARCYATNAVRRSKIRVIPNGVDTDYFQPNPPTRQPANPPTILLTGHMSFPPNDHAARVLIDEIMPLVRRQTPGARCAIVGADPTAALLAKRAEDVMVTGWVEDLRPYFAQAAVYACPMRMGAGIKNKLLEAMAMGCAIVTTPLATDGLRVQDGTQVRLADSPAQFAEAIAGLLRDAAQRERLGQAARRYVIEQHRWDRAAEAYQQVYQRVGAGEQQRCVA